MRCSDASVTKVIEDEVVVNFIFPAVVTLNMAGRVRFAETRVRVP